MIALVSNFEPLKLGKDAHLIVELTNCSWFVAFYFFKNAHIQLVVYCKL